MSEIVSLRKVRDDPLRKLHDDPIRPLNGDPQRGARDDTLWAVVAAIGKNQRVAEIYPTRAAALADRNWREQQVRAYASLFRSAAEPAPRYSVAPIRRQDLPRAWTPLPALGFLRGRFV